MTVPATNKLKSFAVKLALCGVLMIVLGLAYLFLTPKSYQATARFKLEKRDWIHGKTASNTQDPYDPSLAPAECQVLRSNTMLDRVIQNLNLSQTWSERYGQGAAFTTDHARELLLKKAEIYPLPDSTLIAIKVTGEDPVETAKIANEFARVYLDYRRTQRQNTIHDKIDLLQQQWEVQNKKVQEAQAQVDQITFRITADQAKTDTTFYDSDSYQRLQAKRIQLESQTVQLRDQLKQLKALPPTELRQVLSTFDSQTNSVLNASLALLRKANNNLIIAESDHGPASPECKRARLVVDDLEKRISQTVVTVISMKETDLAAHEENLAAFNEKLKHAKAVSGQPDAVLSKNASYAQAYQQLQQLKKELIALQSKMDSSSADEALMPVVVTAELVDPADVPSQPHTPDRRVALGTMGGGAFFVLLGIGVWRLGQRTKPAPRSI